VHASHSGLCASPPVQGTCSCRLSQLLAVKGDSKHAVDLIRAPCSPQPRDGHEGEAARCQGGGAGPPPPARQPARRQARQVGAAAHAAMLCQSSMRQPSRRQSHSSSFTTPISCGLSKLSRLNWGPATGPNVRHLPALPHCSLAPCHVAGMPSRRASSSSNSSSSGRGRGRPMAARTPRNRGRCRHLEVQLLKTSVHWKHRCYMRQHAGLR
jgi:hypothetical protein